MTKTTTVQQLLYTVPVYRLDRSWEVQPKPYRHPLRFRYSVGMLTSMTGWTGTNMPTSIWPSRHYDGGTLSNECYAKLVSLAGDSATWANNLHEAEKSLSSLTGRLGQLVAAARALRKGDFPAVLKAFASPESPKAGFKPRAKDFSNQWLEYHFGWEPMVQDIGAAMHVLQSDFGSKKIRAQVSRPDSLYSYSNSGNGRISSESETVKLSCKMGATIQIQNANLFLANQMGFVNPLSVAWEAVPYSFVVDWFANVGQILSSMSDFVGLAIFDAYTTTSQRGTRHQQGFHQDPVSGIFTPTFSEGLSVFVSRDPGIAGPTLRLRPFKGFSFVRGATACSLLLQKLR